MASKNYFSHTDSLARDSFVRMADCAYPGNGYRGENIAAGNSMASATFLQWRNSSGHNANMLNDNYRAIGIGRAYSGGSTYRWYWTTTFGNYVDPVSPPPPQDTTPPAVTLTSPAASASVSGSGIVISASASDASGIAGVQFQIDNQLLGSEDTSAPYSTVWNSSSGQYAVPNGQHVVTAIARDNNNLTASTSVTVTVSNTTGTPPTSSSTTTSTSSTTTTLGPDASPGPSPTPPPPPAELKLKGKSRSKRVTLSWSKSNMSSLVMVEVYRSKGSCTTCFKKVARLSGAKASYRSKALPKGRYHFYVRGLNSGVSATSNAVSPRVR